MIIGKEMLNLFNTHASNPRHYAKALASYLDSKTRVARELCDVLSSIYRDDILFTDDGQVDEEVFPKDYWNVPLWVQPLSINGKYSDYDKIAINGIQMARAINGRLGDDNPDDVEIPFVYSDCICRFDDLLESLGYDLESLRLNIVPHIEFIVPFDCMINNERVLKGDVYNVEKNDLLVNVIRDQDTLPKITFSLLGVLNSLVEQVVQSSSVVVVLDTLGSNIQVTAADISAKLTQYLSKYEGYLDYIESDVVSIAGNTDLPVESRISMLIESLRESMFNLAQTSDDGSVYFDNDYNMTFNKHDYTGFSAASVWNAANCSSHVGNIFATVGKIFMSAGKAVWGVIVSLGKAIARLWKKWITPAYKSKDFVKSEYGDTDGHVDVPLFIIGDQYSGLKLSKNDLASLAFLNLTTPIVKRGHIDLTNVSFKYEGCAKPPFVQYNDYDGIEVVIESKLRQLNKSVSNGDYEYRYFRDDNYHHSISKAELDNLLTNKVVNETEDIVICDVNGAVVYQQNSYAGNVDGVGTNVYLSSIGFGPSSVLFEGDISQWANTRFMIKVKLGKQIEVIVSEDGAPEQIGSVPFGFAIGETSVIQDYWESYNGNTGKYGEEWYRCSGDSIDIQFDTTGKMQANTACIETMLWAYDKNGATYCLSIKADRYNKLVIRLHDLGYFVNKQVSVSNFISNYTVNLSGLSVYIPEVVNYHGVRFLKLRRNAQSTAIGFKTYNLVEFTYDNGAFVSDVDPLDTFIVPVGKQPQVVKIPDYWSIYDFTCTFRSRICADTAGVTSFAVNVSDTVVIRGDLGGLISQPSNLLYSNGSPRITWSNYDGLIEFEWSSVPVTEISSETIQSVLGEAANPIDIGTALTVKMSFANLQLMSDEQGIRSMAYPVPVDYKLFLNDRGQWRFRSANSILLIDGSPVEDDEVTSFLSNQLKLSLDPRDNYDYEEGDVQAYKDLICSRKLTDLWFWCLANQNAPLSDYFEDYPNGYALKYELEFNKTEVSNLDLVNTMYNENQTNYYVIGLALTHLLAEYIRMKPLYMRAYYLLTGEWPEFSPYVIGDRLSYPLWHVKTDFEIQQYAENVCAVVIVAVMVIAALIILKVGLVKIKAKIRTKRASLAQRAHNLKVKGSKDAANYDEANALYVETRNKLRAFKGDKNSEEYLNLKSDLEIWKQFRSEYKTPLLQGAKQLARNARSDERWAKVAKFFGVSGTVAAIGSKASSDYEALIARVNEDDKVELTNYDAEFMSVDNQLKVIDSKINLDVIMSSISALASTVDLVKNLIDNRKPTDLSSFED